jgi:hypothetical protein
VPASLEQAADDATDHAGFAGGGGEAGCGAGGHDRGLYTISTCAKRELRLYTI